MGKNGKRSNYGVRKGNKMTVSIVIPNWNGREKLERNLPNVIKTKGVGEIIIVDDASSDKSVEFIKKNYPQIKLIEKKKNTGFGSNVNKGVSQAKGDLVFLLNTDAVPEEDCLKNALSHFKDPRIFSVGFNTGGNWSWAHFINGEVKHFMSPKNGKLDTHETLWASGGSSIIRRDVWDKLKGFNPLYDPFYVEDLDLGYRARKRGFINIWDVNAKVEHYKQIGVIAANFKKSRVENTSERNMLIFTWINIHDQKMIREHIVALLKRIIAHPKFLLIFISAAIHLPEILKRRSEEKKEIVISDREILEKY